MQPSPILSSLWSALKNSQQMIVTTCRTCCQISLMHPQSTSSQTTPNSMRRLSYMSLFPTGSSSVSLYLYSVLDYRMCLTDGQMVKGLSGLCLHLKSCGVLCSQCLRTHHEDHNCLNSYVALVCPYCQNDACFRLCDMCEV